MPTTLVKQSVAVNQMSIVNLFISKTMEVKLMQERIIILSWYMTFSSEIPSLLTSKSKRRVVLKRFREHCQGSFPHLSSFPNMSTAMQVTVLSK